ncbi:MAG TPA: carboxypeptidase-like regulatory domain-containing protein [Longimicrobiales bacterium]|nr:carboxypeptidase-like regulatory domain-containing protein [Longimicrobiales bacterium]
MKTGPAARDAALAILLLALPGPWVGPGAAQEGVVVRGRVLDAVTRAPVQGAFVARAYSDRGVLTDSAGAFALPLPSDYVYSITVEGLGYGTVEATLDSTAVLEPTTILLPPDPVALQGLTVLVDRFERRRRTHFGSVRVLDQESLSRGAAESAYDLLRRAVPFARECRNRFEDLCFHRRGAERRVELCIDERPAFAGARELESYDPRELYLVEVYDWGRQVRVYSRWYVERLLDEGRGLRPLTFGC